LNPLGKDASDMIIPPPSPTNTRETSSPNDDCIVSLSIGELSEMALNGQCTWYDDAWDEGEKEERMAMFESKLKQPGHDNGGESTSTGVAATVPTV